MPCPALPCPGLASWLAAAERPRRSDCAPALPKATVTARPLPHTSPPHPALTTRSRTTQPLSSSKRNKSSARAWQERKRAQTPGPPSSCVQPRSTAPKRLILPAPPPLPPATCSTSSTQSRLDPAGAGCWLWRARRRPPRQLRCACWRRHRAPQAADRPPAPPHPTSCEACSAAVSGFGGGFAPPTHTHVTAALSKTSPFSK